MLLRNSCPMLLLACLAISSSAFVGCNQRSKPGESSSPGPALQRPSNSTVPSPVPPISADPVPPDVRFADLHFEKEHDQYLLKVKARNNGQGTAHVNGGCTWKCPAGLILRGGAQVVSGGFIVQGGEFSYLGIASGMCAGPPALLNLDCSFDVQGDVDGKPGSQKKAVQWSQQVQIPF